MGWELASTRVQRPRWLAADRTRAFRLDKNTSERLSGRGQSLLGRAVELDQ